MNGRTNERTNKRLAATRGTEYGRHMVGVFGQPNDPTTHSFRGHVIREKVYVSGPRARSSLRARACTCQLCRTVSRFFYVLRWTRDGRGSVRASLSNVGIMMMTRRKKIQILSDFLELGRGSRIADRVQAGA
jgi:hypothetical protein